MVGKKNTPKATPASDHTAVSTKRHSRPSNIYSQTAAAAAHALQRRSGALTPADVQILQRTVGNRAVQHLFTQNQPVIQTTLKHERSSSVVSESDKENAEVTEAEAEEKEAKKPKAEREAFAPPPRVVPPTRKFERNSDMGFWMRASVRTHNATTDIDPSKVDVIDINISPERRSTFFGEENAGLQGAHLVAWSAMLRSWNAQLNGKLPAIVQLLQKWLLEDHIADDSTEKKKTAPKRAHALRLLGMLNTPQPINAILNRLEQAVALFIESNQAGSFATQGKSMGGRDEAGAHNNLAYYNTQDATALATVSAATVLGEALKLIDIGGKTLDDEVYGKVISTWYRMLEALYPNLKSKFTADGGVDAYVFNKKSVKAWIALWDAEYNKKKAETETELGKEVDAGEKYSSIGGGGDQRALYQ